MPSAIGRRARVFPAAYGNLGDYTHAMGGAYPSPVGLGISAGQVEEKSGGRSH
jgi:hypothetical protein